MIFVLFALICAVIAEPFISHGEYIARLKKKKSLQVQNSFLEMKYVPFDVEAETGTMIGYEVTAIDQVIRARRSDSRSFANQDNPYRVLYSVYNLRNAILISKLIEAKQAGVIVQVLIEDKKLDNAPKFHYQDTDEKLGGAGFAIIQDIREPGSVDIHGSLMAGIKLSGRALHHSKLRIFKQPAGTRVFSMGMNPGDNAVNNDDSWNEIFDVEVQQRYLEFYQHYLEGGAPNDFANKEWDDSKAVQVFFSPANGDFLANRVLQWIDEENELLIISVFSIRNFNTKDHRATLYESVANAVQRGALCYVVSDKKQLNWRVSWYLRRAGCTVYEAYNDIGFFNAMHIKSALFGITDTKLITDTSNWSENALGSCVDYDRKNKRFEESRCVKAKSVESMLFIRSSMLDDNGESRRRAFAHFFLLLTRYQRQQAATTPSAEEIFATLEAHFGSALMPFQLTTIYVQKTTAFGEYVTLRGQLCSSETCAQRNNVRIRPFNVQNRDSQWLKTSLDVLSFEDDSAMDWVCNTIVQEERDENEEVTTYIVDGYGLDEATDAFETLLPGDEDGQWWRFSFLIDAPFDSVLQVKALHKGPGIGERWEQDIAKPDFVGGNAPAVPASAANNGNHFARVGRVTRFAFDSPEQTIDSLPAIPVLFDDNGQAIEFRQGCDDALETVGEGSSNALTIILGLAAGFFAILSIVLCMLFMRNRSSTSERY